MGYQFSIKEGVERDREREQQIINKIEIETCLVILDKERQRKSGTKNIS